MIKQVLFCLFLTLCLTLSEGNFSEDKILKILLENGNESSSSSGEFSGDEDYDQSDSSYDKEASITQEQLLENHEVQLSEDSNNCPDTSHCSESCMLGHAYDQDGCRTCNCMKLGMFDGDIAIESGASYCNLLMAYTGKPCKSRFKRGAVFGRKWLKVGSYVEVPYTIASQSFGTKEISAIQSGFDTFHSKTCVKFRARRSSDRSYLKIIKGGGCYSTVGKSSRPQDLSIGSGCATKGIVAHELMHALGFWHEQSRPDRDRYVIIVNRNIKSGYSRNFNLQTQMDSHKTKYDLGSVMHYHGYSFSKNRKPTIIDKKTRSPVKAQRRDLSTTDVYEVNRRFNCRGVTSSRTITTTATQSPPTPTSECRDSYTSCQRFVRYCPYSPNMKKFCRKTCNLCGPTNCIDKSKNCKFWTKYCHHARYGKHARDSCPKSCRVCASSDSISASYNEEEETATRQKREALPEEILLDQMTQLFPTTSDNCKDQSPACKNVASFCGRYNYIKRYCPRTCKQCPDQCNDKHKSCTSMKHLCKSPQFETWSKKLCPKTCDLCPRFVPTLSNDLEAALDGSFSLPNSNCKDRSYLCSSMKKNCGTSNYVKLYCAKTCKRCDTCKDMSKNCKFWTKYCHHGYYGNHVRDLCPKSCRVCASSDSISASYNEEEETATRKKREALPEEILLDQITQLFPTTSDNCKDQSPACKNVASFCGLYNYIKRYCPRTCKQCPDQCNDKHKSCTSMKHLCKSPQFETWSKKLCPKTCDLCPRFVPTLSNDIEAALDGSFSLPNSDCEDTNYLCPKFVVLCDKSEKIMSTCPKTCGKCGKDVDSMLTSLSRDQ